MKRKVATRTAFLQNYPGLPPPGFKPSDVLIALNKYVVWDLKRRGFRPVYFANFSPVKTLPALHRDLKRKYGASLKTFKIKELPQELALVFRNHLCWEIQHSYFFLSALDRIVKKFKIDHIEYEPLGAKKSRWFSKDTSELIALYASTHGLRYTVYEK